MHWYFIAPLIELTRSVYYYCSLQIHSKLDIYTITCIATFVQVTAVKKCSVENIFAAISQACPYLCMFDSKTFSLWHLSLNWLPPLIPCTNMRTTPNLFTGAHDHVVACFKGSKQMYLLPRWTLACHNLCPILKTYMRLVGLGWVRRQDRSLFFVGTLI